MEDTSYEYHYGDSLSGVKEDEFLHLISTDIFHSKTALLLSMEIESLYYQVKNTIIFPLICSNCGMNNELVDENVISQDTDDKRARLLCMKHNIKGKNRLFLAGNKVRN